LSDSSDTHVRIVTYNVHKCRGMDRRTDPLRIADILRDLDADVIALQEVMDLEDSNPVHDQARAISAQLRAYRAEFGSNRLHRGAPYGNLTLTRLPVRLARNYDLTWRNRERRGCLRTDVELANGSLLHVFNVHLGTGFIERRQQGRTLLGRDVLGQEELTGPRVVVGDFNEWTRGLASKLMANVFDSVDMRAHARFGRTYPGILPLMHLDHFYFDRKLRLKNFEVYRTRTSLRASDHLPLVANYEVEHASSPR
jgi:endonuclease/exonuclease/phosphatase family metal-dependent hydrolase